MYKFDECYVQESTLLFISRNRYRQIMIITLCTVASLVISLISQFGFQSIKLTFMTTKLGIIVQFSLSSISYIGWASRVLNSKSLIHTDLVT